MEKNYQMEYKGTVFHIAPKPPKLIRFGSGEIIQWCNTRYPKVPKTAPPIAEYREAEITNFSFIHTETGQGL